MIQGSEEWQQARIGKLTASRISEALATTKTGWGAGRANMRAELITERLTGVPTKGWISQEMQWGMDTEPYARDAYGFYCNADVEQIGFVDHPRIAMSGASPDGLVGLDGLVELKCPNTATHIETLLDGAIPKKYRMQVMWQMAVTGRQWCDLVSFDPRLPEQMRLHVTRIQRDEREIAQLEKDAVLFLSEVETIASVLLSKFMQEAA